MRPYKVYLPPSEGFHQHPQYDFLWVSEEGSVYSSRTGEIYEVNPLHNNTVGYPRIRVRFGEQRKKFFVHRLVAEALIPNPHNYAEVNHKDGDKQNYHVSNLEWCSKEQNMQHARDVLGWVPFQ